MKPLHTQNRVFLLAMVPILVFAPMAGPALAAARQNEGTTTVTEDSVRVMIEELQTQPANWEFTEYINRGRLALVEGSWGQATAFFESAANQRGLSNDEKAAALYMQAVSKRGDVLDPENEDELRRAYVQSAQLLNDAQQLAPRNGAIASERVLAWTLADDPLERMIAEQHLASLDGSLSGREVMEPITVILITVKVVGLGIYALDKWNPDWWNDFRKRVEFVEIADEVMATIVIIAELVEVSSS